MVADLAGPKAGFVTGGDLLIDGGFTHKLSVCRLHRSGISTVDAAGCADK